MTETTKMCTYWNCREACRQECARCRAAAYCSQEHQKLAQPHHRLVCDKPDALDGWLLASTIHKWLGFMDPRLDQVRYGGCWLEKRTNGIGNTVTFGMRRAKTDSVKRINDVYDFGSTDKKEGRDTEGVKLRCMAYWAMRCMSLGCAPNYLAYELLKQARSQGYKFLVFGQNSALSLEPEPVLVLLSVKSRHTLVVKGLEAEPQRQPEQVAHWVCAVGQYVVDLASARFWAFRMVSGTGDVQCEPRPVVVCDKRDYGIFVGDSVLVDTTVVDAKAILKQELDEKAYIAVALGAARVTLADYLTRSHAVEVVEEEQQKTEEDDEVVRWLRQQQERMATLTIDGPAEFAVKKEEKAEEESDVAKLRMYTGHTKVLDDANETQ